MEVLEERTIPDELVDRRRSSSSSRSSLSVWVYRGTDWLVRDPDGPHVAREAHTVQFEPTVVESFDGLTHVAKIVGVSDDHGTVAAAAQATRTTRSETTSRRRARSRTTSTSRTRRRTREASSQFLAARYDLDAEEIATIGDMPNDVLMFAHSGLSIAMGNAEREVQQAARRVTTTNDEDGFAHAVERFILRGRRLRHGHG